MDWHTRYTLQAKWTHDLRTYLFGQAGLQEAGRVLEVGCGTGAILSELPEHLPLHGLDLDAGALTQCRVHVPTVSLIRGDALRLPYSNRSFHIVYCHYLLLWVSDPSRVLFEMKRVTEADGHIFAFAEPDYTRRVDRPDGLIPLGQWQTESLRKQGADPGIGSRLAELFIQAGIKINETGRIQSADHEPSRAEWENEWAVIESDLTGNVAREEIQKMKRLDRQARERGERVFHVPTYFAWGHA
jgi:SAM-dependent methyltransferase